MNYRVIKENDLFLLTDEKGDIVGNQQYELGLYTKDTRFLSSLKLLVSGVEVPTTWDESINMHLKR